MVRLIICFFRKYFVKIMTVNSFFVKLIFAELNLTISETAAQLDNLLSLEEIAVVEEGTTLLYAAK